MHPDSEDTPTSPLRALLMGALAGLILAALGALAVGVYWLNNGAPPALLLPPTAAPSATSTPATLHTPTPRAARPLGGSPTLRPSATRRASRPPGGDPTHTVTPTPQPVATYTVQSGETLSAIAYRLGLSLANLAGYNGILDSSLIHVGQVLQVPPGGYIAPPVPTPSGPKQVVVSISQQRVFAYQGERLIYNFLVSTGKDNSTWIGEFAILDKLPYPYSVSWGFYMPNWLGIYFNPDNGNVENGFHALPITPAGDELWADDLGTPVSYGCIILTPYDAKVLYEWVEIGTPVLIYP